MNPFKFAKKITTLSLSLGLVAITLSSAQAGHWVESTKGPRYMTGGKSHIVNDPMTVEDFKALKEGDQIEAYCPMMKKTYTTYVTEVDKAGHQKIKETKSGWEVVGCDLKLKRNKDGVGTKMTMVCPDGTVTPVECHKMRSDKSKMKM
jgi:hypothetical protein